MPQYIVTALEKFVVKTIYEVEASSPQEAEEKCRKGEVAYDDNEVQEGDEEWITTLSVEQKYF